jgi:hypothetical protein
VSPAKRVRIALAEERRRGADFDLAWERALDALGTRSDWRPALDWSREEWRAAYELRSGSFDALSPVERMPESAVVVLG